MSGRTSLLAGANLFELSPLLIDESDRIGFLHEDVAVALGRLMVMDGQNTPILVTANPTNPDRPWKLVTGMHRMMGARLEGITVFAIEVSGPPEYLRELQARENSERRTPPPIERAKFTAALVQAAQERLAREHGGLKQQQLAQKARWAKVKAGETRVEEALTEEAGDTYAKLAHVYGWEESVGDALGMSRRSIHRDLELYRLVIEPFPELVETLSQHPVAGKNASQLRLIAQVREEGQRRKVIEALIDDGELTAEMARARIGIDAPAGPAATPERKHVNAIVGGLSRLTATAQKHHLDEIVGSLKSDEVKRLMRDRLNRELGE